MKIVYVVGGLYNLNGMSNILIHKINYLAKNTNNELYIILTERPDLPYCYDIDSKVNISNFNINFDELDTLPLLKKVRKYLYKKRLYKRLFKEYLFQIKPDITISALRREINFIIDFKDGSKKIGELHFNKNTYRNINIKYLPSFINKILTQLWLNNLINKINKLDKFIVLTEEDKKAWGDIKNIIVIPNFLSYFPEEGSTLSSKKAIAVGRYTWQKGFDLLIKAWSNVHKFHPDWELHIYGTGDKSEYESLAIKENVNKTVYCHSAEKNIYKRYMQSSIFILSSRYEGFMMVIPEAMSCGLAVVSFDCPCGPKDIINNNLDGFLVENGNIKELEEKINLLIEKEDLRKQMGNMAMKNIRRYNEENVMQQWIDLFNSITK